MRILIADDHDLVRAGMKQVLDSLAPGHTLVECSSFAEAQDAATRDDTIDLAILDLHMPHMKGAESVAEFHAAQPGSLVVILSGQYRAADVWDLLTAGAAGFIPKTMGSDSVLKALQLVLAGERYIPSDILEAVGADIRPAEKEPDEPALRGTEGLSRRETQVLEELIKGHANKVIGANLGIEEVTVKLHLRNIFRKMGATSRTQAVTIALQSGWPSLSQLGDRLPS